MDSVAVEWNNTFYVKCYFIKDTDEANVYVVHFKECGYEYITKV